MKYARYIFKLFTLTMLAFVLASYGFSSSTIHSKSAKIGWSEELTLTTISVKSKESEQLADSADVDKRSDTKNAKNCRDVTPLEKVSGLPKFLRAITGDHKLRPKDKVPEFTLPRVDGEEIVLYDVLKNNDYVVIDFWATACGPCIAQFPKLKELYSTYNEFGFEIVSVCTDFTSEQWEESLEEHKLPWIDVGEINDQGLVGPTSKAFRLRGLPRSYLVDTNGCILHTHIFPTKLESFLKAEYGEKLKLKEHGDDPASIDTSVRHSEG